MSYRQNSIEFCVPRRCWACANGLPFPTNAPSRALHISAAKLQKMLISIMFDRSSHIDWLKICWANLCRRLWRRTCKWLMCRRPLSRKLYLCRCHFIWFAWGGLFQRVLQTETTTFRAVRSANNIHEQAKRHSAPILLNANAWAIFGNVQLPIAAVEFN